MSSSRATAIKAPPYSVASEKIVLGSILREPKMIAEIRTIIRTGGEFFRPEYGRLYTRLLQAPQQKPGEEVNNSVAESMTENDRRDLLAAALDAPLAIHHARNVAEKARMRHLIEELTNILHDAYHSEDGFDAIIQRAQERLSKVQLQHQPEGRDSGLAKTPARKDIRKPADNPDSASNTRTSRRRDLMQ